MSEALAALTLLGYMTAEERDEVWGLIRVLRVEEGSPREAQSVIESALAQVRARSHGHR